MTLIVYLAFILGCGNETRDGLRSKNGGTTSRPENGSKISTLDSSKTSVSPGTDRPPRVDFDSTSKQAKNLHGSYTRSADPQYDKEIIDCKTDSKCQLTLKIEGDHFEYVAHLNVNVERAHDTLYVPNRPSFFSRRVISEGVTQQEKLSLNFQDHANYNPLDSDLSVDLSRIVSRIDTFFIRRAAVPMSGAKTVFIVSSEEIRDFNTRIAQSGGRVTELYFNRPAR